MDIIAREMSPAIRANALPSYEEVITARDQIEDLVFSPVKFQQLNSAESGELLRTFKSSQILESQPFQLLKEELRRFTFPTVKAYLCEVIETALPATRAGLLPLQTVALRVHWEVNAFLAGEINTVEDLSRTLTITGGVTQAQALSCGAYMDQTWPQTGSQTLEAIKHALKNGHAC